jgi:dipeptidase E
VPDIVAIGGGGFEVALEEIIALTGKLRPHACFVPTASAEDSDYSLQFYETVGPRVFATHLKFFPWPRPDLREHVLAQDLIWVGGGNTANMLALWRVHDLDRILRDAWESGVVLCGSSAGAICWFEAGVTDSFGPQLEGMADGLGYLAGSACPHYDGEERRRPRYRELVDSGFPEGVAADDGVGLHYVGTELREVVACRRGAAAYRVTRRGEEKLPARLIPS